MKSPKAVLVIFLAGVSVAAIYFYASIQIFNLRPKPSTFVRDIDRDLDLKRMTRAYDHVDTILLFIGYPRSRHTLVAALLDAHPNIMLSNEIDLIHKFRSHTELSRNELYDKITKNSFSQADHGERSKTLNGTAQEYVKVGYQVPGQWQGTFDNKLKILGDKIGWTTAATLARETGRESLRQMEEEYNIKTKFIHVVRNPFDNIATLAMRRVKMRKVDHIEKHNIPNEIDKSIKQYFGMARNSQAAKNFLGDKVFEIRGEDFVRQPASYLRKLCDFLEITCSEQYLMDCASIVDPVPSITRTLVVWTEEQINEVKFAMRDIEFLHSYTFEN